MDYAHGLEIGDLVTTYHKGVWRITDIERRFVRHDDYGQRTLPNGDVAKVGDEYNSLIHYEKVLNGNYNRVRGNTRKKCDASFCTKLDAAWAQEQRAELERKIKTIEQLRL